MMTRRSHTKVCLYKILAVQCCVWLHGDGRVMAGRSQTVSFYQTLHSPNYKIHASWVQPPLISLASTGQHCLLWGLGSDLVIILESWSEAVKIRNHIWHTTRSLSRISQASFPRQLIQVIPMFREYRKSDRIEKPYFCDHEWRFIIVIVEK